MAQLTRSRRLLRNLSVVGLQWGDEGKGKVVDFLAGRYTAVARFNGGSNAGHTVVIGTKKYTFHLVPSGALEGVRLLIGAGVAMDPLILAKELEMLPPAVRKRIVVDSRCTLVTPLEIEFDGLLEDLRGSTAIGTTRRGIGPSYAMRAFRLAPRVSDLLDGFDVSVLQRFYNRLGVKNLRLSDWIEDSKRLLKGLAGDVSDEIISINEKGGSILFEASQGTLLDLLHGSYPFVTSSHTIVSYVPAALGIPPEMSGEPFGVAKCYTTRVGSGPFPTELGGESASTLRELGNEYGSTTGRPRRVGWLDLVSLRYAIRLNGVKKVALTKLDVLSRVKEFRICTAYDDDGSESVSFQKCLSKLGRVKPVYSSPMSLSGTNFSKGLSTAPRRFIEYLEDELRIKVVLVSHGEDRAETLEL